MANTANSTSDPQLALLRYGGHAGEGCLGDWPSNLAQGRENTAEARNVKDQESGGSSEPALPQTNTTNNATLVTSDNKPGHLGVVLMNLGGPTSEEAAQAFLYNLFRDDDIIKLGGGSFQRWLAGVIAKRRGPKVAEKYRQINGCPKGCEGNAHCPNYQQGVTSDCCSPLNPLTERQRQALQAQLQGELSDWQVSVYTAMRYWKPFAQTTLEEMKRDGVTHAVLLPLYPQFSWTTSGSSFREWASLRGEAPWQEYLVKNFYQNPNYIAALNNRIDEALARFPAAERSKVHLVFSAHGTPMAEVRSGDPYTREIRSTMEAVMAARGYDYDYWLGFQSRVGPQKWTQPNTESLVQRLLNYGQKHLLMIPIAFVTDHIETLMELNIELREAVAGMGLRQLEVMEGLNDHPQLMTALSEEVQRALGLAGPTPATEAAQNRNKATV
jgi:ferrochelatase